MEEKDERKETVKRVLALVMIVWASILCGAGAVALRAVMGWLAGMH